MLVTVLCATALVSGNRFAAAAAAARQSNITIDNYTFRPRTVTIARGTTVVWINKDDDVHTIKSQEGPAAFSSPALQTGGRFGFTFKRAGTYRYICTVHPFMHGVIVVR